MRTTFGLPFPRGERTGLPAGPCMIYGEKLMWNTYHRYVRYAPVWMDVEAMQSAALWGLARAKALYQEDAARKAPWRTWVITLVRQQLGKEAASQKTQHQRELREADCLLYAGDGEEWRDTSLSLLAATDDGGDPVEHALTHVAQHGLHRELRACFGQLQPTDRTILYYRYWEDETMQQVATRLGVTRQRICQREAKALARLRGMLRSSLQEHVVG
jgi:RNA polymerase sigma factor (sigma-70 family)